MWFNVLNFQIKLYQLFMCSVADDCKNSAFIMYVVGTRVMYRMVAIKQIFYLDGPAISPF